MGRLAIGAQIAGFVDQTGEAAADNSRCVARTGLKGKRGPVPRLAPGGFYEG